MNKWDFTPWSTLSCPPQCDPPYWDPAGVRCETEKKERTHTLICPGCIGQQAQNKSDKCTKTHTHTNKNAPLLAFYTRWQRSATRRSVSISIKVAPSTLTDGLASLRGGRSDLLHRYCTLPYLIGPRPCPGEQPGKSCHYHVFIDGLV